MIPYGKEFFYTNKYFAGFPQQFALFSKYHTTVAFEFTAEPSLNFSVVLDPDVCLFVDISSIVSESYLVHVNSVIGDKSLRIVADSNITVSVLNAQMQADDATPVYPVVQPSGVDHMSDTFYLVHPFTFVPYYPSTATVIVSHYDCVEIEILPNLPLGDHPANIPFNIILDKGATFSISSAGGDDYTGTRVRVVSSLHTNPISIYNGNHTQATFPWDTPVGCCADFVIANCLPTHTYDTLYFTVPPFKAAEGSVPFLGIIPNILKVFSPYDNNRIYLNNIHVATLHTGDILDTISSEPIKISSDYPVSVNQFYPSVSVIEDNNYGDPDHVLLLSEKHGFTETYIRNFEYYDFMLTGTLYTPLNYVTLITRADGLDVTLDGININSWFTPFPAAPEYVYAQFMPDGVVQSHLTSHNKMIGYNSFFYRSAGGATHTLGQIDGPVVIDTIPEITFCDSFRLTGRESASTYVWSNGSTAKSILATETGVYWVRSHSLCDSVTDTFYLREIEYPHDLLDDLMICRDDSVHIDIDSDLFVSYLWNDGHTSPERVFNLPGKYSVQVEMVYENCPVLYDTMRISFFPPPELQLEERVFLCDTEEASFSIGEYQVGMRYYWSTGDTTCCIVVDSSGYYEVIVSNFCGDSITVGTHIRFIGCESCLRVPNAFSPNNDGLNDKFNVVSDCEFEFFQFEIYDRWGTRVFKTSKVSDGWDGRLNGKDMDAGVYFFFVKGIPLLGDKEMVDLRGDVTLIR